MLRPRLDGGGFGCWSRSNFPRSAQQMKQAALITGRLEKLD
jgi:hypothetical protein